MDRPSYQDFADELYRGTSTDWHVAVSLILTEPVCAVVTLSPDDESFPPLRGFLGTHDLNESVKQACAYHLRSMKVEGRLKASAE